MDLPVKISSDEPVEEQLRKARSIFDNIYHLFSQIDRKILQFTSDRVVQQSPVVSIETDETNIDLTAHLAAYNHALLHTRSHAIDGSSDHTSSITQNNLMDADSNGLPDDSGIAVGNVTQSSANMTDNTLLKGDGGAKNIQDTGIAVDDSNNVSGMGTLGCGAATINGASTIGDGGTTNYTQFGADGTMTMAGTARVYDGIEIDPTNFKEPAANSATKVNRGLDIAYEFTDGQDGEHIHVAVRTPSKWVDTEDIAVILIWSSPTTSAVCDWEVRYLFLASNQDTTNTTPDGTASALCTSSSTANGLVHSTITIPTAAFDAGDKRLVFQVYRDGNDASDTLSASAFLQGISVRGTANKIGGV